MFLKSIRLTAFKCHENLVLDFSRGDGDTTPVRKATFLTGEAGTGKTALLQAIAILTGGSAALRSIPGQPDDDIQLRKRFALLEATVLTAEGVELELTLRLVRGQSLAEILEQNKDSLTHIDALLSHPDRGFFTAAYGSRRKPDSSGGNGKRGKKRSTDFSAIGSLFGMDDLPGPGTDTVKMSALKQALNTFLPPEIRFKGPDKNNGQSLFTTPDGTLPLHMLSRGHQQKVAWVSSLFNELSHRSINNKNPLQAHGLLLISEIDLHMHPTWQRLVPGLLKEYLPNFQVIATTYSPHIAQQAGPGELYALHRDEGGKVELLSFNGDPSRMLLHQLLMSPMFGLETDESLKVERAKAAVRAAAISGAPAGAERSPGRSTTESAVKDLPEMVNTRSNSGVAMEDLFLMQAINASLQSTKKGRGK